MSNKMLFIALNNSQLLTYSELKQWATERSRPVTGKRRGYVVVYSFGTQVYKSETFDLTEQALDRCLDYISGLLALTSHNLSFVLVSWKIENQLPVVSTTKFGSQLQFRKTTDSVVVTLRPGGYEKMVLNINSSVESVRKKTKRPPRSGMSKLKGLRQNPETKTLTYQNVSCTTNGGCNTTFPTKKTYNRTYGSVRTPGYMALKRKGQLPPNVYSMSLVEVEAGFVSSSKVWTNVVNVVTNEQTGSPFLLDTDIPSGHLGVDENLLISKLAGKINTSRGNLAESLVQSNMTVSLITGALTHMGTFLQLVTGGSPQAITKFLGSTKGSNAFAKGVSLLKKSGYSGSKLLAKSWLEYRYGWLPLIADVQAGLGAFNSLSVKNPGILSVTASRRVSSSSNSKTVYATNPDFSPRTRYYYTKTTTVCKIGIRYKLDSQLVSAISGLGLTSPVSLAWELVPFSFVVDWFLPIGPALQAFSAFEGLTFMSGYKTYFTKVEKSLISNESYKHTDPHPPNSYTLKESGGCNGRRVIMGRSVLTNFPGPKIPRLKSPFSFIHAANAAALVVKMMTR